MPEKEIVVSVRLLDGATDEQIKEYVAILDNGVRRVLNTADKDGVAAIGEWAKVDGEII